MTSLPPSRGGKRRKVGWKMHPFYPNHVLKNMIVLMAVAAAVCAFASFVPIPMEEMADPLLDPSRRPPATYWFVRPAIALDLVFPRALSGTIMAAFVLFSFLLPLGLRGEPSRARRAAVGGLFLLGVAYFLAAILWLPLGG